MTGTDLLRRMFDAALSAADAYDKVCEALPKTRPTGNVLVVGAGKASARMAQAVEDCWGPCQGLVVVPYGFALPSKSIEIVEARHPVPDQSGFDAAKRILQMVKNMKQGDTVVCLISGGGSALLTIPGEGISFREKQAVNDALLKSGATIHDMNIVRKHLSKIKGGRLAAAISPAHCLTLAISDVPGDDPAIIASGPTFPDTTSAADACRIIAHLGLCVPKPISKS